MSWKTLTVLAVLAAGLGGFLVVDSYWLTPKREKTAGVKGRLWTIEPKDVLGLTIKRKDDTVTLKRAGEISRTQTPTLGCRSLDVIHVATALELGLRHFVTFDDRQRKLARATGLKAITPR